MPLSSAGHFRSTQRGFKELLVGDDFRHPSRGEIRMWLDLLVNCTNVAVFIPTTLAERNTAGAERDNHIYFLFPLWHNALSDHTHPFRSRCPLIRSLPPVRWMPPLCPLRLRRLLRPTPVNRRRRHRHPAARLTMIQNCGWQKLISTTDAPKYRLASSTSCPIRRRTPNCAFVVLTLRQQRRPRRNRPTDGCIF